MTPSVEPHLFVILGATGDLTERKLLPAVAHLMTDGTLGHESVVLGVARDRDHDEESFRRWAREALADSGLTDEQTRAWCDDCIHYHSIGDAGEADYHRLADRVRAVEEEHGLPGNRIFYLALPPGAFPTTIEQLGQCELNGGPGWTRLVIEKPFGRDLESARELNALVHRHFEEDQVYRIDHYLGKETVQNLLVFRFANPIFESLWNRDRIASVHITVAEDLGVGDRAGYYDRAGALRDMVQNHLTQLLTLTAMEVPAAFDAAAIRTEKLKVLRNVEPIDPDRVVFGQYRAGSIDGEPTVSYLDEADVDDDSDTETFVALELAVANWRWQGVPFYLRTGKRLPRRLTRIVVGFHRPPVSLFEPYDHCRVTSNRLVISLQPDEGFSLGFEVKTPGEEIGLATQRLRFEYADAFGALPDAYETLLRDVGEGDQTLFVHADEVEAAWRLYTPLLERPKDVHAYTGGSWGPDRAEKLAHGWPIE